MSKVAVVTRTKDRPVFLKRAIESVACQSYDDYEHVIVNDGGKKETLLGVIDSFDESVRKKIKVFHRSKASNAPDTIFNESIDRVMSQYVVIHDDDDSWHPEFLKRTTQYLDDHTELAGVVVRTDKVVEQVEADNTIRQLRMQQWMPDMKVINLYRQCIDNQMTPIAFLFKRSAYEKVGKFDSTLPVVGDWEFGIRLLQQYDVDFLDPGYPLAYYHHRKFKEGAQGNTSFSGNDKHRYYTNLVMNQYLRKELSDGRLGVGYIMSQLKYNQSNLASMVKKFLPGGFVSKLKKRIQN